MRACTVKAALTPPYASCARGANAREGNAMSRSTLFLEGVANPGGYRDVSPQQLSQSAAQVRIVDVREPHEFNGDLGHIEGAELAPMGTFPAAASGWDRDVDVVLICRSGNRSGRVAAALAPLGFKGLMNLAGGMLAWNAAALPVKR